MENELIVIEREDYIDLTDSKLELFYMLGQLIDEIKSLPRCCAVRKLAVKAAEFEARREDIAENWGIPKRLLDKCEIEKIHSAMLDNVITPEEAGYIPDNRNDVAEASEHFMAAIRILAGINVEFDE